MTDDNGGSTFWVAVCLAILLLGAMFIMPPITEPEITIEDEQGVTVFIAVHPYFDRWEDYNKTVSILVDGRNGTGDCINSWFLTSYRYERGTSYTVYINGTIVATNWIGLVGDFGTWKAASWWGYVGELVEVCHINLTLYSEVG